MTEPPPRTATHLFVREYVFPSYLAIPRRPRVALAAALFILFYFFMAALFLPIPPAHGLLSGDPLTASPCLAFPRVFPGVFPARFFPARFFFRAFFPCFFFRFFSRAFPANPKGAGYA